MTWKERWIGIPLAAVGAALALASAAALVLTRTPWGQDRVADWIAETWLPRLQGQISFASLSGDDLLRGVRVTGLVMRDAEGTPFLRADTAEVAYDWRDFLAGDVVFRSVRLVRPEVVLQKNPDGSWNFERVFGTGGDGGPAGRQPRIEFRDVRVVDGSFALRTPVDLPGGFWRTESRPDGHWQLLEFVGFDAHLPLLRIQGRSPTAPLLVRIGSFAGVAHVVPRAANVQALRADLELAGDTLSFDVFDLRFPGSRLFGHGAVAFAESGPTLDLVLRGERVALADATWLVPWLPDRGTAVFDLRLSTVADGLAFAFENAELAIGASRVSGRLGFVVPDRGPVRLEGTDLGLDPLETRWIEAVTGEPLFFAGRVRGRFRGDGPPDRMQVDADLRLEPDGSERASHVLARGVLSWDGSFGGAPLEMTFDPVEMRLVNALLNPELPVRGWLSGRATFAGTLHTGLRVEADVVHRDAGVPASRLAGGGVITGTTDPYVDLRLQADSLSLTAVARYYPALPFRGGVRGPIALRGTLDALDVDARFDTPRGRLALRGRFDLSGEPKRYAADIEGERVQVAALRPGWPESNLAFEGRVEGEGLDPEALQLRGWIRLRPSTFAGARVDSGYVRLEASDGVLTVDTAAVATEAGTLALEGRFGLRREAQGTLRFELRVDTLAAWNRWIAPPDTAPPLVAADDGIGPPAVPAPGVAGPLAGAGTAAGTVTGNLYRATLEGRARFRGVSWNGDWTAADLAVAWTAEGTLRAPRIAARVDALDGRALGLPFGTAHLTLDARPDTVSFDGELARDPTTALRAAGTLARIEDGVRLELASAELRLRGRSAALEAPVTFVRSGTTLSLDPFRLRGELGTVAGAAEIPEAGATSLALRISGLDLADLAVLWPDTLPARGAVEADLRLSGTVRRPVAEFTLRVGAGAVGGIEFDRLTAEGRYGAGDLRGRLVAWTGDAPLLTVEADLPLDLDLGALRVARAVRPMEVEVRADAFPLAFALAPFEPFRDVRGTLDGTVTVRGSVDEPEYDGELRLHDGAARMPRIGVHIFDATGGVRFRGEWAELDGFRARGPDGGTIAVEGRVRIRPLTNPEFDLRFRPERFLAYNARLARTVVTGTVHLGGVYRRPVLTGELTVESGALFVREVERRREIIDLSDPAFFSVVDTSLAANRRLLPLITDPFLDNIHVELTLHLARDSWLRARDRAIELAGDLELRWDRAERDLRITGTLRALRGEYTYLGKRFVVEGGTIEFVGDPGINPDLELTARHVVQTRERPLTIFIHVTGTLEQPKIRLTSDAQPPIDEAGLLSYLLFGRPFSELTGGAGRRAEIGSTVREGALGLVASELEAFLVSETGLVDVLAISGAAETDPTYRGQENGAGLATRVEAGWYLAPDVFVSVGQRFGGVRRSEIPDVRLDWRITPNLTLQFVAEERGQRFDALLTETAAPQRTVGIFFFHEWSY